MASPPLALPFTLYPSKWKQAGLMLMGAAFVAVGILMIRDGESMGWLVTVFFGLCLLVFLVQLLPGSSYLSVDTEGFEFSTSFRKKRFSWREIEEFGICTMRQSGVPISRMVGFNLAPGSQSPSKARALSKAMTGFEAALPDTYGFKAEELAELLATHHRDWAPRSGSR